MKTIPKRWGWGGWRPGAGRKPKGAVAGEPHRRRPRVGSQDVVLVRWAVAADGPDLTHESHQDVVRRVLRSYARPGFRIEGLAFEPRCLWLCVRARSRGVLARGLGSVAGRVAFHMNRHLGRRGTFFPDRHRQWLVAELPRGRQASLEARILRRLEPLAERARAV
jgi:hypothetical protein